MGADVVGQSEVPKMANGRVAKPNDWTCRAKREGGEHAECCIGFFVFPASLLSCAQACEATGGGPQAASAGPFGAHAEDLPSANVRV